MLLSEILFAQNLLKQEEMISCLLQKLTMSCKGMGVKCNAPWNILVWTCCCLSGWLAAYWEKQRRFPASCISLLLPCSLIYLGHKDSFPALALCCPLSLSKSTERSVWFPVILPFPSLFPLYPIQPKTVKFWEDWNKCLHILSFIKQYGTSAALLKTDSVLPGFAFSSSG